MLQQILLLLRHAHALSLTAHNYESVLHSAATSFEKLERPISSCCCYLRLSLTQGLLLFCHCSPIKSHGHRYLWTHPPYIGLNNVGERVHLRLSADNDNAATKDLTLALFQQSLFKNANSHQFYSRASPAPNLTQALPWIPKMPVTEAFFGAQLSFFF